MNNDEEFLKKLRQRENLIYQFCELRKDYDKDFFYHNAPAKVLEYFLDFIEGKNYMYKELK